MRDSKIYALAAGILAIWLTLAWFMASWLGLQGTDRWLLRGGLGLLGVAGLIGFIWLRSRNAEAGGATAGTSAAGSSAAAGDVDIIWREAEARLQSSKLAGKAASLPAILVLGEPGSGKTSTVVHSGLDPELMAGQAFQDNTVVPTGSVNLWYSRETIFVDAGGSILQDAAARARLVKKMARVKRKEMRHVHKLMNH